MLIDTHTHLFDDRFRKDLPAVLERAAAAGVERVICLGIDLESSLAAVEIANTYPLVVAAVGIQPNHTSEAKAGDWDAIVKLAGSEPRVVAIGETGLDRYWDRAPFPVQEDYFARHIQLARDLGKPFVIHCRDAEADVVKALRGQEANGPLRAVMHSFSGDAATARECLEMGLYVSFAGMVTYPTAQNLRDIAKDVALDRLLVETDCPYLAPQPVRGKRNEPSYVAHTAALLAQVKGVSVAEIEEHTTRNAKTLFGL
ncbi:TatD family hydrolase [Gemmata sp. G18]|uniref:TatD family hydrolase n=1 Tax=Gemmata palustris TaxID=2822762 RepID=A0ABS5BSE1_9BACT|nr:TatD family hydrolase [Gemmata palustris]MBP3956614.1 TatD family hydrolase [Gemmata palustris]